MSRDLLTVHAAAALLGVSPKRLRDLVDADRVPHVELPGIGLRFLVCDLRAWIRAHRSAEPAIAAAGSDQFTTEAHR